VAWHNSHENPHEANIEPRAVSERDRIADAMAGIAHSAMSWSGFNVYGDKQSIAEVRRLVHLESRLQWFEREYSRLLTLSGTTRA
jgi:hypothetical protein